jgi:hypothetical protein
MKRLFLTLALIASAHGQETSRSEDKSIFVIGMVSAPSPTERWDYFVTPQQFKENPAWDPNTEPFPLYLGSEVARAQRLLEEKNNLADHLQLSHIEITRFPVQVASNKWFITLQFLKKDEPDLRQFATILLMNGSYAEQRHSFVSASEERIFSDEQATARAVWDKPKRPTHLQQRESNPEQKLRPSQKLDEPDFEIPKIQWEPTKGNFPLDLSKKGRDARDYLIGNGSLSNPSAALQAISIWQFLPLGAITAKKVNLSDHTGHWYAKFQFWEKPDDQNTWRDVYFLLDDRLLGAEIAKRTADR